MAQGRPLKRQSDHGVESDAVVPVDAKNAPTRDLENRTEHGFPQRPHHPSFRERKKKKNVQSTSVTKPSTESAQLRFKTPPNAHSSNGNVRGDVP